VATGQWFVDSVGTRWFFDSGALCLDFGYTGDHGYGVPSWERLHGPNDLTAWLTERFGTLSSPVTPREFAEALRLRSAVTAVARSLADIQRPGPQAVDVINEFADGEDIAPALAGGRRRRRPVRVSQALCTIARDAVAVFGSGSERIRHCGGVNCELIFLDSSRPNARRWCSMKRCGNRTKVRIHRNRVKEAVP
jgi:predicted RNA-binding Zn ribbon-like protein